MRDALFFRLVFQHFRIMLRKFYHADRSLLTARVEWLSIHQARLGGEPMTMLSLSDRQRGELEELVSHTPLAKERCRAQALLWITEGVDVAEVASWRPVGTPADNQAGVSYLQKSQPGQTAAGSSHVRDWPA